MEREGSFKVCIFGDKSLGRTTLVNRYLTKVFDEDIKMTVGAGFYIKDLKVDEKNIVLKIWDFAGENRFKVLLPSFAKGADGGIFLYDIARYSSIKNIDDWLSIFEKNVREQQIDIPIIMVGVLTNGKEKRRVLAEDAIELAKKFDLAMHLEISTKTGENVETMFEELTRLMMSKVRMQEKRHVVDERSSLKMSKAWKQKLIERKSIKQYEEETGKHAKWRSVFTIAFKKWRKRKNEEKRRRREEPPIKTTENKKLESDEMKHLIKLYEEETNQYATWRGNLTEGFKKWRKGEKVFDRERERISLYITDDTKEEWSKFIKSHKDMYNTISKLIRESVNYFIQQKASISTEDKNILDNQTLTNISAMKEPLTSIKGFSQLLIENYKGKMEEDVFNTIQNIFNQSLLLEKIIINILDSKKTETTQYDLLMVEDDLPTIRLLTNYFRTKEITCKGVVSGAKALEELEHNIPKLILTDIIHPAPSGYDLCKQIKSNPKLKNIPVFFLTAISESEVKIHYKKYGADGYILKPFTFSDFDGIIDLLRTEKKTILICDDEPSINELIQRFLQLDGFNTITCTSGEEALELLEEQYNKIDLILLDVIMSGMSGYEVLKIIKSRDIYKNIKVVIFSTISFKEDKEKAKELGADGYLVQPVSGNELRDYVKNILNY